MKKTQFMTFNITDHTNNLPPLPPEDPNRRRIKHHIPSGHVFNINQQEIEEVNDFKYFGSYIRSTLHDISVRKAQAMAALHSMDTCWKSTFSRPTKIKLFRAIVQSVLFCGCETWTMNSALNYVIDGFFTRLLRKVLRISWRSHTTNKVLYGNLRKISNVISESVDFALQVTFTDMTTSPCTNFYSGPLNTEEICWWSCSDIIILIISNYATIQHQKYQ